MLFDIKITSERVNLPLRLIAPTVCNNVRNKQDCDVRAISWAEKIHECKLCQKLLRQRLLESV